MGKEPAGLMSSKGKLVSDSLSTGLLYIEVDVPALSSAGEGIRLKSYKYEQGFIEMTTQNIYRGKGQQQKMI